MTIVQLVHGYPPHERAGTERYAAQVAVGLGARGHRVHTLAATRRPGAAMYSVDETPGVTRIVNNAPYAGVRRAEQDAAIRVVIERTLARVQPDVVLVQHPMFLDVGFRADAPLVWMLHDAWAWCAAGGTLFCDGAPCAGPSAACAACTSAWVRDSPRLETALRAAGAAAHLVDPARLHRLWRRVPAALRGPLSKAPGAAVRPDHLRERDTAVRRFAARCRLLAPSVFLADAAAAQGFARPTVVPHGVPPRPELLRDRSGPFVFAGTLAPHKGPALVHAAWRRSGVATPLRIVGPEGPDAAYVGTFPHEPPVDDVPALLAGARALVLGSVWPENAPLVVLEARAVGCPVVAPRIGGVPELVADGVDGWLYTPGDVDALADALRRAEREVPPVRPPPSFDAHLDALLPLLGRPRPAAPEPQNM